MAPKPKTTTKPKATKPKSVSAREAVRAAYEYLMAASPDPNRFSKFMVEEIRVDEKKNYLITLSYEMAGEFGFDRKRELKDFSVKRDGTVLWMKIRKL